jgi:V/A-type H+-transporting ATPase subunit K
MIEQLADTAVVLTGSTNVPAITTAGAAALGVGLAGLGAGIAERGIGSAAVGAIAEDSDMFGTGLIFTVLPETIVILALVAFLLALFI